MSTGWCIMELMKDHQLEILIVRYICSRLVEVRQLMPQQAIVVAEPSKLGIQLFRQRRLRRNFELSDKETTLIVLRVERLYRALQLRLH